MTVNKNFTAGLFALLAMWLAHLAWAQVQTWPQTTALTVGEVAAFPSDPVVELPVAFINNDSARQIATIQFDLISLQRQRRRTRRDVLQFDQSLRTQRHRLV